MASAVERVLASYGLQGREVSAFGPGLINDTWLVTQKPSKENNSPKEGQRFILQRINDSVFTRPEDIDHNLREIGAHLRAVHPDYLFTAPLPNRRGETLVHLIGAGAGAGMRTEVEAGMGAGAEAGMGAEAGAEAGTGADVRAEAEAEVGARTGTGYYRLFRFVPDSISYTVADEQQAGEAAEQFGLFASLLKDLDLSRLRTTLPHFHDLGRRYEQYLSSLRDCDPERLQRAK
ncbi:hypothetical protein B484DRAFT_394993, partial [Ochromonadaceae sp. CCMP2298]